MNTFKQQLCKKWLHLGLAACALVLGGCKTSNEPVPKAWLADNILFTSYTESPKTLDSVSSYSNNETPWTYAVYEPPLKYHYLKRPYELVPRSAVDLPTVTYLDKQGRALPASADASQIAESVFELKLQPGIKFQPHPAFATNDQGQPLYLNLTEAELGDKRSPFAFEKMGSRELTADDYVYAIRRLATPRVKSPAFGFLSEKIVGLADYGKQIKKLNEQIKSGKSAREAGFFGHLPWLDFRAHPFDGAQAVDRYTLRIRVNGKYPQFKYWLAMTFFAPVAWEVDAFYSQAGMKRRNLTADTWPVGTGPFMLTEYVPNARMVLSRNPNYRGVPYPCDGEPTDRAQGLLDDCGKPTPFVDKMVSVIEKEGTSVATKFIQGYYDIPQLERGEPGVAYQVAIQDETGMSNELRDHKIQLPSTIQVGFWHFGFNWLDPVVGQGNTPEQKIRNRKLRQALSIAFDLEEYVSVFEEDRAKPNLSAVVPGLFGNDQVKTNPVVYDLQPDGRNKRKPLSEAKRLLAEAGYPDGRDAKTGKPLVLNYDAQGVGPGYKARIDWVAKQFAKLNVQLEVRNTDYNRFQDKMRKGAAQFFFWGWLADYPDPENFLFLLYGPNSKAKFDGENATNYANPEFDQLFDKMKDLDNTPERAALIQRMVAIMQQDAPMIWGWSEEFGGAYQQWVHNGKPSNIIRDQLPYLRIDASLRQQKIQAWNQPVWWPLAVILVLLLLLIWPAWRAWKRRQEARAIPLSGDAS
jgi:ABC-type transport system substrate-binding protein